MVLYSNEYLEKEIETWIKKVESFNNVLIKNKINNLPHAFILFYKFSDIISLIFDQLLDDIVLNMC